MGANSFGRYFQFTTWGESHGKAIGVVIDGCPAGLTLSETDINVELQKRAPGQSPFTTQRKEKDRCEIYSGVFDGVTTGAPISIIIFNEDARSSDYQKDVLRPGHANYTYLQKYGVFDHRGGGRASARETAMRVAAGAVAKKLLKHYQIEPVAYLSQVAEIEAKSIQLTHLKKSSLFCPCPESETAMIEKIALAQKEGDSLGGVVTFYVPKLPVGLGDPVYEKLEANLAKAMLSIPASKGIEFGQGFDAVTMRGSEHNDLFTLDHKQVKTQTNHAGGTLGGISTGMPLTLNVAFKPTSTIAKTQPSLNLKNEPTNYQPKGSKRHDPIVAIRAVPVVEAMGALTLADALLANKLAKLV